MRLNLGTQGSEISEPSIKSTISRELPRYVVVSTDVADATSAWVQKPFLFDALGVLAECNLDRCASGFM